MAQNYKLTDRDTGRTIYPETSTGQVYAPDGRNLDDILPGMQRQMDRKQTALTTTADFKLTAAGQLSLTDRAKQHLFDDLWRQAWGEYGGIDGTATDGRRYLGNGLRMTYDEALLIMTEKPLWTPDGAFSTYNCPFTESKVRTHLPVHVKSNYGITLNSAFHSSAVEVINLPHTRIKGNMSCPKLRSLTCGVIMDNCTQAMPSLVDVELIPGALRPNRSDISFARSPMLSRQSLINVISVPYQNIDPMTVTVHADVYAKLTDETNEDWHSVLTTALDKNIQFATT